MKEWDGLAVVGVKDKKLQFYIFYLSTNESVQQPMEFLMDDKFFDGSKFQLYYKMDAKKYSGANTANLANFYVGISKIQNQ